MRIFPILVGYFLESGYYIFIMYLDGQFTAVVETSRCQIDGADDCPASVSYQHFPVQFKMPECMNLNADVIHNTQPAYPFNQFFLFQRMRWPGHDMNLYAPCCRTDQPFNDHRILVSFILNKKCMFGFINKTGNPVTSIACTPDHMCVFSRI